MSSIHSHHCYVFCVNLEKDIITGSAILLPFSDTGSFSPEALKWSGSSSDCSSTLLRLSSCVKRVDWTFGSVASNPVSLSKEVSGVCWTAFNDDWTGDGLVSLEISILSCTFEFLNCSSVCANFGFGRLVMILIIRKNLPNKLRKYRVKMSSVIPSTRVYYSG